MSDITTNGHEQMRLLPVESLQSFLQHTRPGCLSVEKVYREDWPGHQLWQVVLTDSRYKNSPLRMPMTFHAADFTEREVLNHRDTERWLERVTGYRLCAKWELP